MKCEELERNLERLLTEGLEGELKAACDTHLAVCGSCRELLELASLTPPLAEGESLAAGVLARTSGPVCGRAEELLCDLVDGRLQAGDRAVLDDHVTHCDRCSALVIALARLDLDLPTLAVLETDPGLVRRVLAATLPLETRLRRWWNGLWPALIRRPRFAVEMAYAVTALVVLMVTVPGSPLQAMPERALEIVRRPPSTFLEEPVREGLTVLSESEGARVVERRWLALQEAGSRGPELVGASLERARTFFAGIASLLQNAAEDSPSEPAESTEETS